MPAILHQKFVSKKPNPISGLVLIRKSKFWKLRAVAFSFNVLCHALFSRRLEAPYKNPNGRTEEIMQGITRILAFGNGIMVVAAGPQDNANSRANVYAIITVENSGATAHYLS